MSHVLLSPVVCPTESVLIGFILNSKSCFLSIFPRLLKTVSLSQTMTCNTCIKLALHMYMGLAVYRNSKGHKQLIELAIQETQRQASYSTYIKKNVLAFLHAHSLVIII